MIRLDAGGHYEVLWYVEDIDDRTGFRRSNVYRAAMPGQFEIDPDHFDGTDSWQAASLAKVHVRKTNRASAGAGEQALHGNTSGHATLRSAATRNVSKAQGPEVVAVQNKRKASIRKERHDDFIQHHCLPPSG